MVSRAIEGMHGHGSMVDDGKYCNGPFRPFILILRLEFHSSLCMSWIEVKLLNVADDDFVAVEHRYECFARSNTTPLLHVECQVFLDATQGLP